MIKRARPNRLTAFNALYATYRNAAINRGRQWNLSKERFLELVTGNCHYCGIEPHQVFVREPHRFTYNGVDRIDSSQGYHSDNCVSCCGQCNIAKIDRDPADFLSWIDRVYQYQHRQDKTT